MFQTAYVLTVANLPPVPRQVNNWGFLLLFRFASAITVTVVVIAILPVLSKYVVFCAIVDVKVPFRLELLEELLPDLFSFFRPQVLVVNDDMDPRHESVVELADSVGC